MKKLATILSILTLSFGAFASDIKTADTLVSEFSAIKGKAETQAYNRTQNRNQHLQKNRSLANRYPRLYPSYLNQTADVIIAIMKTPLGLFR